MNIFSKKRDDEGSSSSSRYDATWKRIKNEINKVGNQEMPEVTEVPQASLFFEILTSLTGTVKLGQLVRCGLHINSTTTTDIFD